MLLEPMSQVSRSRRACVSSALLLMAAVPSLPGQHAVSAGRGAVSITLGRAIVPLDGPWRFHTGDDSRWADPDFDDASWETVDLTPAAGAHDPDVGLAGYVPGWGARGHRGYAGYAWYRMRVSVAAADSAALALAGPLEVDQAYELFANGRLLGGSGNFDGAAPVVYNTRPAMFSLSDVLRGAGQSPNGSLVIAVRVWAGDAYMRALPDGGGMRIAPALGDAAAITARYKLDWLAKVLGYVVEVVEAAALLLLAVMALAIGMFEPSAPAYRWLASALVLTALARANQAVFYWTPWESAHTAIVLRYVYLDPLALGAWAMAWRDWFRLERPRWLPGVIAALTGLYVVADFIATAALGTASTAALAATSPIRLTFVIVTVIIISASLRRSRPIDWLSAAALVLVSIGLYAQEVSALHVPGIWFPFGVGVSRTQYAYAAFAIVFFVVLYRRLAAHARARQPARVGMRLHAAAD
ncbi:MAG TPA: hypothetical protein VLD17_08475 [Gemmatimonadaceae bacterium]|nr:hypothetical protein [Gemmatimonadaceae bacterium]